MGYAVQTSFRKTTTKTQINVLEEINIILNTKRRAYTALTDYLEVSVKKEVSVNIKKRILGGEIAKLFTALYVLLLLLLFGKVSACLSLHDGVTGNLIK